MEPRNHGTRKNVLVKATSGPLVRSRYGAGSCPRSAGHKDTAPVQTINYLLSFFDCRCQQNMQRVEYSSIFGPLHPSSHVTSITTALAYKQTQADAIYSFRAFGLQAPLPKPGLDLFYARIYCSRLCHLGVKNSKINSGQDRPEKIRYPVKNSCLLCRN